MTIIRLQLMSDIKEHYGVRNFRRNSRENPFTNKSVSAVKYKRTVWRNIYLASCVAKWKTIVSLAYESQAAVFSRACRPYLQIMTLRWRKLSNDDSRTVTTRNAFRSTLGVRLTSDTRRTVYPDTDVPGSSSNTTPVRRWFRLNISKTPKTIIATLDRGRSRIVNRRCVPA